VAGLLLAAVAVYVGWQLPHRVECDGGDACHSTLAIDWSRVDWGIPPQRYACGVTHPGPGDVVIGPGDVCVTARADGTELDRVTYEGLRERIAQRRILTLAVIALILTLSAGAAATVGRRRPARAAP
jgi:hypothetical protein